LIPSDQPAFDQSIMRYAGDVRVKQGSIKDALARCDEAFKYTLAQLDSRKLPVAAVSNWSKSGPKDR
jgi:hypothetical protein